MDYQQLEKRVKELEDLIDAKRYQSDYANNSIKQRHLEALLIFTGIAADLPDGTTEVQAYFATDTNTLYLFNGVAWKSVVLT